MYLFDVRLTQDISRSLNSGKHFSMYMCNNGEEGQGKKIIIDGYHKLLKLKPVMYKNDTAIMNYENL